MRSDQERLDEYFQNKNLARAIREGTQPRDYAAGGRETRENFRRFNESTRNRALLLAAPNVCAASISGAALSVSLYYRRFSFLPRRSFRAISGPPSGGSCHCSSALS